MDDDARVINHIEQLVAEEHRLLEAHAEGDGLGPEEHARLNRVKVELDKYCKDVTPGEDRLLKCLEAHQDKVSHRCEYALFKASHRFEEFLMAFKHLAHECASDVDSKCPGIPAGDGRIAQCLIDHKDKVSAQCTQAMKDTEMDVTPAK